MYPILLMLMTFWHYNYYIVLRSLISFFLCIASSLSFHRQQKFLFPVYTQIILYYKPTSRYLISHSWNWLQFPWKSLQNLTWDCYIVSFPLDNNCTNLLVANLCFFLISTIMTVVIINFLFLCTDENNFQVCGIHYNTKLLFDSTYVEVWEFIYTIIIGGGSMPQESVVHVDKEYSNVHLGVQQCIYKKYFCSSIRMLYTSQLCNDNILGVWFPRAT